MELRPYQNDAVAGVRAAYLAGKKAPLLVLPTGGGKTVVFAYIAKAASERSRRVLILVHRVELVRQTADKLFRAGVRFGVIHPDFKADPTAPVQVASVQALVRRLDKMPYRFDLVVTDEAHHATAGTWARILNYYHDADSLGVTATPCRSDGTGLGAMFDELVEGPTVGELIAMGYLVQPVVYAPPKRLDLSGVKITRGDYDAGEVEERVDKPSITGDAVEHYRKFCPGVPAVAFCISVAHAEHVAAEFNAAGFRAVCVDGSMSDVERRRGINGLADGTVDVLCSCSIVSEGTDIPAVGAAILLRPTQSQSLYLQQVGRALRPCEGKPFAYILDHVGNCFTHGMPDETREWSLEGEKKKRRGKNDAPPIKVKQCPECYACHKPAPTCPQCGFEYPMHVREVEHEEGELQQVTPEMRKAITKARTIEVNRTRDLEGLQAIEKSRGYKEGWAERVHMARNKKETGI